MAIAVRTAVSPAPLSALLKRLHPKQAPMKHDRRRNVTVQTIRNIRWQVRKVLERYENELRRHRVPLSASWDGLLGRLPVAQHRYQLISFARYASGLAIEPKGVDDALAEGFLASLRNDAFIKNPSLIDRRMRLAWNRAAREIPGWPQQRLSLAYKRPGYCLKWDEVPESYRQDVEALLDHLARKTGRLRGGPRRALRPESIIKRRFQLLQAVSISHRRRGDLAEIASLRDIIDLDRAASILEFFLEQHAGEPGSQSTGMLDLFIIIAKHWAKVDAAWLEELMSFRDTAGCTAIGLTEKNRNLLLQFNSERNLGALLHLPARLARAICAKKTITEADALSVQSAVLIEIELMTAIRLKNLTRLRPDTHLVPLRDNEEDRMILVLVEGETKNREPGQFPLPSATADLIRFYIDKCRPLLSQDPAGWLFPGEKPGTHKNRTHIGRQITKTIFKHTGLQLNTHAFRHLLSKLHLKENPGELEIIRRFLGHKRIETTMNAYVGFNAEAAVQRVDSVILRLREALPDTEGDQ
jgi:site-specific recombinase XerD